MKLQFHFAVLLTLLSVGFASTKPNEEAFLRCLVKSSNDNTISDIIHSSKDSTFSEVLNFYIQNSRFMNPETPKPVAVLTPAEESQIQTVILCGRKHNLEMRVRSGGHDHEGSSYISEVPFFVLDMFNFRSISVDVERKAAWVGAGATLGELYYEICAKNSSLTFPAGIWPTVGVGGHISGGGYGPLTRQFGLAADNVIDARIIDVNGRILDRKSMGEDLFWAIRGGIGSSFVVILSYELSLVEVPEKVVAFTIERTLEQNAIGIAEKWQEIAPKVPFELTLTAQFTSIVSTETGNRTILAQFTSYYLGDTDKLLSIMGEYLPELGLTRQDCREMIWIQIFPFTFGFPIDHVKDFLTSRVPFAKPFFKIKPDFVKEPIPSGGLEKIFHELHKVPPHTALLGWTVFGGGVMDTIPESEIPFPHRGNLMLMREAVMWTADDNSEEIRSRVNWLTQFHNAIEPYVPSDPRGAYIDYRDLDLGVNNVIGATNIEQARRWGIPYFKNNFDRLVKVKTLIDPEDFFRNEQSFPSLHSHQGSVESGFHSSEL